jgi:hypothetical protein
MGIFSGLSTPQWLSQDDIYKPGQKDSLVEGFLTSFSDSLQSKKAAKGDTSPAPAWLAPWTDEGKQLAVQNAKLGIQSKGLEVARQSNMLDYQTQSKAGEVALSAALSDIAKTGDWNNPEVRSKVFDVATKFPALMDTPVWQHTQDNFQKSDKAAAEAERYKAQADQSAERIKIQQDRLDLQKETATANEAAAAKRQDLTERRFAQTIQAPTNEPKEKTLEDGTKLVWMPGAKTLHVIKGDNKKEMSPSQLQSIAKDLEAKNADDPDAASIRSFLTAKAEKQITADKPAAPKAAMGGYKINTVYKGGLKYLGGDPKDQNNWEKVQ